ncbi:hypothetical protein Moror_13067 [Moniliophthora roreri MCA 2997]|nr:hypothetical protein Moror_13067 [Moniliophthora roreri MCA 2997]KAI3604677.1 hypothetical protein WG66_008462 [Moniliophthora roreri]
MAANGNKRVLFAELFISEVDCPRCHFTVNPSLNTVHITELEGYISRHPGNHLPPVHEQARLENLLRAAEGELSQYEERIREMMEQVEKSRVRMTSSIRRLRVMIKPSIHRLPPELLSHIFMLHEPRPYESQRYSLILSHVCTRWRALALSMPRLWCRFGLIIPSRTYHVHESHPQRMLNFVKFCLENSGDKPLDLSVYSYSDNESTFHRYSSSLAQLVAHSHRWRHVDFDTGRSYLEIPESLPMLETISLRFSQSLVADRTRTVSTPRLRSLCLNDAESLGRFDLQTLTELTITEGSGISAIKALDILRSCKMLTSFSTFIYIIDEQPPLPSQNVVVSSLRTLDIQTLEDGDFFSRLTLPCLSDLTLIGDEMHAIEFPFTSFYGMLSRSRPTLLSLNLEGWTIPTQRLLDVLLTIPSLETFIIWNPESLLYSPILSTEFLEQMTFPTKGVDIVRYKDSVLLPSVVNIHFELGQHPFDHNALTRMVDSRFYDGNWTGDTMHKLKQLQSFSLCCCPTKLNEYTRSRLMSTQGKGLKVSIEFLDPCFYSI